MYVCLDCGLEFEEPAEWVERHGLDPSEGPGEHWSGCPDCHGAYEEVYVCGECVKGETE